MSEYTFKNLNEIDMVDEPLDGTTMMGFEDGVPIQMPMSAVKADNAPFVIDRNDPEVSEPGYGNKVMEAIAGGRLVYLRGNTISTTGSPDSYIESYFLATHFEVENKTADTYLLSISTPSHYGMQYFEVDYHVGT